MVWRVHPPARSARRVHDPEPSPSSCARTTTRSEPRACVDTGYFEAYNPPERSASSSIRERADRRRSHESGLRVGDEEFAFDTIVLGPGFDALAGALLAIDLRGRGGRPLREKWSQARGSALGLTITGLPNLSR